MSIMEKWQGKLKWTVLYCYFSKCMQQDSVGMGHTFCSRFSKANGKRETESAMVSVRY